MAKKQFPWKTWVKTGLKIGVTAAALWWVFRKINYADVVGTMHQANSAWIAAAALLFIASKIVSAFRLNCYFRNAGLELPGKVNFRLYWLGMFYNMFLPGGIGGDGYKVYLLNKRYQAPVKQLFLAVLLDRISGVAALVFLCIILYLILFPGTLHVWIAVATTLAGLGVYYWAYQKFFPSFKSSFWTTNHLGIWVQVAQLLCAACIVKALHIDADYYAYLFIFLLSSIVAVIPFTIGGLGAREMTFLIGSQYLHLNQHASVSISVWFYLITLVISLSGIIFVFRSPLPVGSNKSSLAENQS